TTSPELHTLSLHDALPILFNPTHDPVKWELAADAALEAITFLEGQGHELYYYEPQFMQYSLSDTTITKLNIRNSVTEKWNPEIRWEEHTSELQSRENLVCR